jgi:peptidyl-prolyl cis-trans isomerase A (cyclophilin A)
MKDRISLPWTKSWVAALALLFMPLYCGAGGKTTHRPAHSAAAKPYDPALLTPLQLAAQAPAEFDAKFVTTKGDFVIHVTRAWAPLGADRFYNLVKYRFYNRAGIFRMLPKFVVQFGISAYPEVSKAWHDADIKDDPVTQPNARWTVSFATDGPNTRTTQIFINVADNTRLDARGFTPFGKVTEGIRTIRKFYSGYGESASKQQDEIEAQGMKFLAHNYPKLDSIKSAAIIPGSILAASPPAQPKPAATQLMVTPSVLSNPGTPPKQSAASVPQKPAPAKASPPKQSAASAENAPSAPSASPAGGTPSYDETRMWFVSKMNQAAGHRDDDGSTISYQNVSLDGCMLKYREVWQSGTSVARDTYDVTIPLVKLSTAATREGVVKLITSTTAVHIAKQEKVPGQHVLSSSEISTSRTDGSFQDGQYGYVVNLDFRKQGSDAVDISTRVAAALEHASDVCKQNAPKPREPF